MPGMVDVWHWQNWAEGACCSLPDSRTVSTCCAFDLNRRDYCRRGCLVSPHLPSMACVSPQPGLCPH